MVEGIVYPTHIMMQEYISNNTIDIPSNFKATHLYVKRHRVTGLMYFGQTKRDHVQKYSGSGTRWLRHLKKHGKDIETVWTERFNNCVALVSYALTFSKLNDIVKSPLWANQVDEDGLDGGHGSNTGKRMFESPEGVKKFYVRGSEPVGWIPCIGNSVKGTRSYKSPTGVIQRFEHGTQPVNWIEFTPTNSANKDRCMFVSPEGQRKYWSPGSQPEGWVRYSPTTGTRLYRNPILLVNKRFAIGFEEAGYFEYHNRWGYKDKSIADIT